MSIRAKILLGCLCLTLVTMAVGVLAQAAQAELGDIALRIYDEAFLSMSYLRSAQNTLTGVGRVLAEAAPDRNGVGTRIASALDDLDVAEKRAMSTAGRLAVQRLEEQLGRLAEDRQALAPDALAARVRDIEERFDSAVEVYAGDGYRARLSVAAVVRRTARQTWAALAASLAVALAITVALSRTIVPSLRHALEVATSIAAGRLDNVIEARGSGEAARLLKALGIMQDSISANMQRIRALMAAQASSHAGEIDRQHARFEAALNNMSQGLCMFDSAKRVLVHNRQFAAMFGEPVPGMHELDVLPPALVRGEPPVAGGPAFSDTANLEDGRIIVVARRPMAGGGWVATYEDATERHRTEARMAHMARHDALTGLPNRVLFRDHTEQALSELRRGDGLAVLCLDLDHFKAVNDTLGHPTGDALLTAVARRLLKCTEDGNLVVRLGGDEFAVVQSGAGQPELAKALAERILATLGTSFTIAGQEITVAASIGVAVATGGASADELLKSADIALYRAKAEGRGTYRFFEAEMDARIQTRRRLELDLRQAMAEGQFEVHYQPLVSVQTGAVSAVEALVRWRHPTRGMVSPAEFIPVAEETGLIAPLGLWVLNRACADAMGWPGYVKVAVNLSPVQFRDGTLADEVADALHRSGLAAHRLELEITESLLLQDSDAILSILHELRAHGVRISMDDFGTGYSSLSYLRRFPFDKIKIDQSFIRNLSEREDCIAIVRAVIGLGRSLGMSVTAEGVETEEQFQLLRAEGCTQVQGYLFSPPRPFDVVSELIGRYVAEPIPA